MLFTPERGRLLLALSHALRVVADVVGSIGELATSQPEPTTELERAVWRALEELNATRWSMAIDLSADEGRGTREGQNHARVMAAIRELAPLSGVPYDEGSS